MNYFLSHEQVYYRKYSHIDIYTDGSCQGNPGHGGFAYLIIAGDDTIAKCEHVPFTSNNRMELAGVIESLKKLDPKIVVPIYVYTDSQYVSKTFTENRLPKWKASNYKNIANVDLWKELDAMISKFYCVEFKWVKAHNGHPFNSYVDQLARIASKKKCSQEMYSLDLHQIAGG